MDTQAWRARIQATDGTVLGTGFLLTHDQVMTCAHVVHGHDTVRVVFLHATEPCTIDASIESDTAWSPDGDDTGDVAVLRLTRSATGIDPPRFAPENTLTARRSDPREGELHVYGFPKGYTAEGTHTQIRAPYAALNGEWLQAEAVKAHGIRLQKGFSGAAVTLGSTGEIVGMIIGADRDPTVRTGKLMPLTVLAHHWPALQDRIPPDGPSSPPVDQIVLGEILAEPPAWQPRQALMDQLAELADSGPAVVCSMTGARGVGKSQLAAAYARHRADQGWPIIVWLNAETPEHIIEALDQLATKLGIRDPEHDPETAAGEARLLLEASDRPSLLVFDNATDPDLISRWRPRRGTCQVIITSTHRDMTELGHPIDVGLFTDDEATAYLQERTDLGDEEGALSLATELGNLPLALAQAAAVIRRQRLDYRTYLRRLREFPLDDYLPRARGQEYPHGAAQAILMSVLDTQDNDHDGTLAAVLNFCALLSPAGIHRMLCAYSVALHNLDEASAEVDEQSAVALADSALGNLAEASLIGYSTDGTAVIMHRLVARVVRQFAAQQDDLRAHLDAATGVLWALRVPRERAWPLRAEGNHIAEQIDAVWDCLSHPPTTQAIFSSMAPNLLALRQWAATHYEATADFTRAITAGQTVLDDRDRILGPDHTDTLSSRNSLASAYWTAGQLDKAIPLLEQTLPDRERVLGLDHPNTLSSRNNLASAYWTAGQLDKAIPLLEQTVADCERVLGPDHPNTLSARNNLAKAYETAEQLDRAIPLFEQTLPDRERVLGLDHPDTLSSRNNLATTYWAAGQLDKAIPLFEQTLSDRERVLGPDHPDTLSSCNNLAAAYKTTGQLGKAIQLFEQTLTERERVLGPDHPDTLTAYNNLASTYLAAGQLDMAILLFEQTLSDRERVLGLDHPDTLSSRNNLARVYKTTGQLDKAIQLFEQTLTDCERVLSADHPTTRVVRANLTAASGARTQMS